MCALGEFGSVIPLSPVELLSLRAPAENTQSVRRKNEGKDGRKRRPKTSEIRLKSNVQKSEEKYRRKHYDTEATWRDEVSVS